MCFAAGVPDRFPEGQRGVVERAVPHRPDHGTGPGLLARGHPGPQGRPQAGHLPQVLPWDCLGHSCRQPITFGSCRNSCFSLLGASKVHFSKRFVSCCLNKVAVAAHLDSNIFIPSLYSTCIIHIPISLYFDIPISLYFNISISLYVYTPIFLYLSIPIFLYIPLSIIYLYLF